MKTTHQTIHSLTAGTLHSSQVFQYRTRDGQAIFSFSYELEGDHYEVAIHSHPDYNGRSSGSRIAHWLPYNQSPINKRICFSKGKAPNTLEKAKSISMEYAELTWTYIKTGVTIDEQILRQN